MSFKLRKKACHCGWKFEGFHICADLSTPEPVIEPKKKAVRKPYVDKRSQGTRRGTPEWKELIAKRREATAKQKLKEAAPRDAAIVEAYKSGLTIKEVAAKLKYNHNTIRLALHRAQAEGKVTVRPRGGGRR